MPFDNMLAASLHIRMWTGAKTDDATTDETLTRKRADRDAGRFNKFLVPKARLAAVEAAHWTARRDFHRLTLPFETSMGIVSGDMFEEFRAAMVKDRQAFEEAAREFIESVYPQVVAEAQARLGDLYDASEYPAQETLRERFRFALSIMPIPAPAELKLATVTASIEQELRQEYEKSLAGKLDEARREVWLRVLEPTVKFAETMANHGRFKASTVENLREVVRIAPRMLPSYDTELGSVCLRLEAALDGIDAQGLRESEALREECGGKASALVEEINRKLKMMKGAL